LGNFEKFSIYLIFLDYPIYIPNNNIFNMLNKKGHFTPISSMLRIITVALMLIFLDMGTRGTSIDPGMMSIFATVAIITTLASFIPI